MGGVSPEQAELELLIELASGGKTFTQVQKDAHRLGLESLDHSNPSRGITERLRQLTGVSKESLSFFSVKCNPDSATEVGGECMRHPFVLISTIVEKALQNGEYYVEVEIAPRLMLLWHPLLHALQNTLVIHLFRNAVFEVRRWCPSVCIRTASKCAVTATQTLCTEFM